MINMDSSFENLGLASLVVFATIIFLGVLSYLLLYFHIFSAFVITITIIMLVISMIIVVANGITRIQEDEKWSKCSRTGSVD